MAGKEYLSVRSDFGSMMANGAMSLRQRVIVALVMLKLTICCCRG